MGCGFRIAPETTALKSQGGDSTTTETSSSDDDEANRPNVNMCSAYTHVFADTLRSFAVIFAASFAAVSNEITAEQADASAAVVVCIVIFVSLLPLLKGLWLSYGELRRIRKDEKTEARSLQPS